jgi:membrane protease YdiL (CAAX protease family)
MLSAVASGRPLLPRRPPGPVPWNGPTVLTTFLLWFVLQVVVYGAYLGATGQQPGSAAGLMTAVALANAAALVLIPLALRGMAGARPEHLGLGRGVAPGVELARGAVAGLVLAPAVYAVGFASLRFWPPKAHPLERMIRDDPSGRVALLAVLSGVLLAPAAEELLFRGILQGWLVRLWGHRPVSLPSLEPEPLLEVLDAPDPGILAASSLPETGASSPWVAPSAPVSPPRRAPELPSGEAGPWPGLVTSALFAAIHASEWPAPIPIFVLSLGLGYVYQRTGGVLAPFGLHATFNGISTLMLLVSVLSGSQPAAA